MAAVSPLTEARELDLVGKVEMRIALAKDEKLESVLKVYLPPLLLKLASDHVAVRNKVNRYEIPICFYLLTGNRSSRPASISKSDWLEISKFCLNGFHGLADIWQRNCSSGSCITTTI
jgi:hypothetical protein